MCLGIPMRVESIPDDRQAAGPPRWAMVELGGVRYRANLDLLGEVTVGDYVLVHAGFALQKVAPEEAEETLELIRAVLAAEDET